VVVEIQLCTGFFCEVLQMLTTSSLLTPSLPPSNGSPMWIDLMWGLLLPEAKLPTFATTFLP